MIFVDASAIVAILADECERDSFLEILQRDECLTTPLALFEATLGIARIKRRSIDEAADIIKHFLDEANIREIPIQPTDLAVALDAAARFGKGRGHPAQLNLGDCFAYAAARGANAKLPFKGHDFGHTDIAAASA